MAVVIEVTDQRMAAVLRLNLREQLSATTPEKSTVTEKREVNIAPDSKPYLACVKFGIATLIM